MAFLIWVLKKHKLLILIFTAISCIAGSIYSRSHITPMYEARALLMVVNSEEVDSKTSSAAKIDYMTLMANKQIAKTYSDVIASALVLEPVAAVLKNTVTLDELRRAVVTQPVGDSELIEVKVKYHDAQQAADIANTIASYFTGHVKDIFKLSNVKLVDQASVNLEPVTPTPLLYSTVSAMAGLILVILGCLTYNHWRRPTRDEDIKDLALSILGRIPRLRALKKLGLPKLMTTREKLRRQFWHLQTLVLQKTGKHKVVFVTSAVMGEGKSTVCLGLALALAHSGLPVALVDANVESRKRITALCETTSPAVTVGSWGPNSLRIYKTRLDMLKVISVDMPAYGAYPFFASEVFQKLLAEMKDEYVLVLIDGSSLMNSADALLMASQADGVLLVVKEGIPGVKLTNALNQLRLIDSTVYGTVINRGAGVFQALIWPWEIDICRRIFKKIWNFLSFCV